MNRIKLNFFPEKLNLQGLKRLFRGKKYNVHIRQSKVLKEVEKRAEIIEKQLILLNIRELLKVKFLSFMVS